MNPLRLMHSVLILIWFTAAGFAQNSIVNVDHLRHLTERIPFAGDTVSIVHVYSDYPDYVWTDAKESGPEGIACVDDAARAAVLYCRRYELEHDQSSLREAMSLLRFIMAMQTDDGCFYNFIRADHSINRDGKTSFKSFGWWAARGVWAMATGYRVMRSSEPAFSDSLGARVRRSFPHIDSLIQRYGSCRLIGGFRTPEWLLYESGADVTSELVLGLIEYYRRDHDRRVEKWIRKFADGLMVMQNGDMRKYPYGLHRSWETMWHMWGNSQTAALAGAGAVLHDTRMIRSAELEAKGFYTRLLIDGYRKEMDVTDTGHVLRYEQIAYGVRPMTVGLLRLYDATKNSLYLRMAGLSAAWLFGNNVLHQQMYDSVTGRCFDGITDSSRVNKNSGAESTIEALMALLELKRYPGAMKYAGFRQLKTGATVNSRYAEFRDENSNEKCTLKIDLRKRSIIFSRETNKPAQ